ncbi:Hsp20/alpha crystallin family protein [Candidatus Peregrinibacteria bacterium]|nr:Hsp20/alpha crystallin family protein [Candidatus Peregrinibacteria bacterium]
MATNPQSDDQDLIEEKELGQLSVDVYETNSELIIIAPIAGVRMENINLTVTDDVLTINGHRQLEHQVKNDDYVIQECFWGEFSRSIVLPDNVDTSKINASFKDGILKISIPKMAGNLKTKLIKIKSA